MQSICDQFDNVYESTSYLPVQIFKKLVSC